MKTTTLIALGLLTGAAASQAATVLYDNTANFTDRVVRYQGEMGDQIRLYSPDPAQTTQYVLTLFSFEYYAGDLTGGGNAGANLSGGEQAILRFYQNDGTITPTGLNSPGFNFFTSPPINIANTEGEVLEFSFNNLIVPDTFTWTVEFTGITGTEDVGLSIYTPPAVGDSPNIYWRRDGGAFQPFAGPNGENIDFGSFAEGTLTIVPEPGSIALFGLGALGLLAMHRRFKKNS